MAQEKVKATKTDIVGTTPTGKTKYTDTKARGAKQCKPGYSWNPSRRLCVIGDQSDRRN